MKKLTIADIKATEILSKEERKMVLGGDLGSFGTSCFSDTSCYSNERCIRGYCVNYRSGEAGGNCYSVIYIDSSYSGGDVYRIAFFGSLQEADNYAFNISSNSSVNDAGVYNCR